MVRLKSLAVGIASCCASQTFRAVSPPSGAPASAFETRWKPVLAGVRFRLTTRTATRSSCLNQRDSRERTRNPRFGWSNQTSAPSKGEDGLQHWHPARHPRRVRSEGSAISGSVDLEQLCVQPESLGRKEMPL